MKKYKYYLRKPRSEIVKDILIWSAAGGVLMLGTGPALGPSVFWRSREEWRRYPQKKFADTFSRLRREGLIEIQRRGHRISLCLTEEGRKKAGRLQIDALQIRRPKKWDKKWRVLIFDIAELKKTHRDAFRGKLQQIGFRPLQKSVWVCPFECRGEVDVLREFFGLNKNEARLIVADEIDNSAVLAKMFNV